MKRHDIKALLRNAVTRARLIAYATKAIIEMMRWG
jgi:hypothetical protein